MSQSPIQAAIQQICQEKNLSEDSVLATIEAALAAAYRKDFGNKLQNIITEFDAKTGGVKVFDVKTVVEDLPEEELAALALEEAENKAAGPVKPRTPKPEEIKAEPGAEAVSTEELEPVKKFNPRTEIQIKDAKLIDKKYKIGDEIVTPLELPGEFGRMAAQTAKQVIIQKLREQERQNVYEEYKGLEGEVVNGTIYRREGRNVLVDLGHAVALMPFDDQVERERYNLGNRMKFYLRAVEQSSRGPQIIVSRSSGEVVRKIFEMEIPEIANGAIEIKGIAREAGNRSKVAISTDDENIDPIGSCVGQRGARIQTIINELGGEKIDIILWDEDPAKFITNALSPAKVAKVEIREEGGEKMAVVRVKDDQLSLAIGRSGQNVRLASHLAGYKIDIISETGQKPEAVLTDAAEVETEGAKTPAPAPEPVEAAKTEEGTKEEKTKNKKEKKKKEE